MDIKTKYIISLVLAVVGTLMIVISISMVTIEKNQREKCLNLPINEFFKDKDCKGVLDNG